MRYAWERRELDILSERKFLKEKDRLKGLDADEMIITKYEKNVRRSNNSSTFDTIIYISFEIRG